jgi:putative tricarboxylic transport membrane protein
MRLTGLVWRWVCECICKCSSMFRPGIKIAAVILYLALGGGIPAAAAPDLPSFQGKTITMLTGDDPGGGTDAAGRLIALYLHKYLAGAPAVVVQNMSGANGMTAMNYFVRRTDPNGLTLLIGSISSIDPLVYRSANAQYDPRSFRFVGGIGRGGSVIVLNRAAESRLHNKSARPVMIGSVQSMPRPGTQPILWGIEYLGWNGAWVGGYRGTNETMLALDRGEVDMTATGNMFQIQDRLNSGQLEIVCQTGALKDGRIVGRADFGAAPFFPDLMQGKIGDPVGDEAFRLWATLNTGDKWLALVPGTSDVILAAFREAFDKLSSEPEFLEQGARISEGFAPMSARDVESVVATLADTPAEAVDFTKAMMRRQGLRIQ